LHDTTDSVAEEEGKKWFASINIPPMEERKEPVASQTEEEEQHQSIGGKSSTPVLPVILSTHSAIRSSTGLVVA